MKNNFIGGYQRKKLKKKIITFQKKGVNYAELSRMEMNIVISTKGHQTRFDFLNKTLNPGSLCAVPPSIYCNDVYVVYVIAFEA